MSLITADTLTILETLGEGGFAVVRKAKHTQLGTVAYKQIKVDFINDIDSDRLKQEATIHKELSHLNIVILHAMVFEQNNYGLILEYMAFGDLKYFLEKQSPHISCSEKLAIIHDASSGMSYLHSRKTPVIHGDLKIQNVLVNEARIAKISDFGFSQWKNFSRSQSKAQVRFGTISHVAPENLEKPLLRKTESFDVYGFGVLMWEVFTQEQPYPYDISDTEIRLHVPRTDNPLRPDMTHIPDEVPDTVKQLIEECWSNDATRRPKFEAVENLLKEEIIRSARSRQNSNETIRSTSNSQTSTPTKVGQKNPMEMQKPQLNHSSSSEPNYLEGQTLKSFETRPGGNLLLPIHRLVSIPNLGDVETMTEFSREYVQFVCACLNERSNGTIHYGIRETGSSAPVDGEVIGVSLKKKVEMYQDFLNKAVAKCFNEQQIAIAVQCTKPAKFVKLTSDVDGKTKTTKYVIDINIIPASNLCKQQVFYVKLPKLENGNLIYEGPYVIRTINGKPRSLHEKEIYYFQQTIPAMYRQRKQLEDESNVPENVDNELCDKFIRLLCHGDEKLNGDHYEILVITKPADSMDKEYIQNSLAFLNDIQWRVIFDFDAEATICQFVQDEGKTITIAKTDDFNSRSVENIKNPDRLEDLHDNLETSVNPTWLFVNGYNNMNDKKLNPFEWKKQKSEGFKEAVRFFGNKIPNGRAMVVFLLLSPETDVVLEAAEEFITMFRDQWMCVAETEQIGKPWMNELVRRHCVEPDSDRYVWGVPWDIIQRTVSKVLGPKTKSYREIPSSTGHFVPLVNKIMSELIDIDILSCSECEKTEINMDKDSLFKHEMKVRDDFYKGNTVSWWNFWFHGHVCKRDISDKLKKQVRKALVGGQDEDSVGRVFLYHQPGAGGTTVARQVLWELRKEYRCGIIHNITEAPLSDQILKLYRHEDSNPKPVLLLLDNPDIEKANLLSTTLMESAKPFERKGTDQSKTVLCVFLICIRTIKFKKPPEEDFVLKHELSPKELAWFEDKNKSLKIDFQNKEKQIVDPKLLISFNLMKEGFSKDFIRRTAKEFVDNITDPCERNLLKYISLLNAFDFENRSIPTSSFDGMMIKIPWQSSGIRRGKKAISLRWETNLSADIRVLLNETSKPAMGYIHSLRITSVLLARETLSILQSSAGCSTKTSDIVLEFISCAEIFNVKNLARDNLVRILKDVLKRRQLNTSGKPQTNFSLLIEHIINSEMIENAIAVMKKALIFSPDPFIDQQLARLYIKAQNWKEAIHFAKSATDQKPENSFLWDTFGRIYEKQLLEEYENIMRGTRGFTMQDMVPAIEIALEGMRMFRKVQEIGEQEKTTIFENKAGFYGELQMVVCLLDCFTYVFPEKEDLKRFVLDDKFIPEQCSFLVDVGGKNYLEEIKSLEQHTVSAMNRLEDEFVQLRAETLDDRRTSVKYEIDSIVRLKENLNSYFGEDDDSVPANLDEKSQCDFRRRRILRLAGHNIGSIFELRWKEDGCQLLKRIRRMVVHNIGSSNAVVDDYRVIISVNLALTSIDPKYLHDLEINYKTMVDYSRKLYELRHTSKIVHLEAYLYFVMFNWPRKNAKYSVAPKIIESSLIYWKDAYYGKYPRQRNEAKPYRKKDTTMFFLANGSDMASIYTTFEERGIRKFNEPRGRDMFWRMPDTMRKLQRFDGVLSSDGTKVSISLHYGQGNKSNIAIATSLPIYNRSMWNKKVFFVIGFSWIGPKAFDISLEDPTDDPQYLAQGHTGGKPNYSAQSHAGPGSQHQSQGFAGSNPANNMVSGTMMFYSSRRNNYPEDLTQEEFNERLAHLDSKLEKIKLIREKRGANPSYQFTTDEEKLLSTEKDIAFEKKTLIKNRKSEMESRIPEF